VDDILDTLMAPTLERGAIAKISQDVGIPALTLRDWHRLGTVDSKWFPLANGHPRTGGLNRNHKIAITNFVCPKYNQPGIGTTRTHLKHLYLDSCAGQEDDERHLERFSVSATFLKDRQSRPALTLGIQHKERKAVLNEVYTAYFLKRLNSSQMIINQIPYPNGRHLLMAF
jgi:hypothetical protein